MELTTLLFLGFFAAVALLNYALPRVLRPYCLLAASYLFYCWGSNDRLLVPVLITATLVTWGCGLVIGKCRVRPVRVIFLLLAVLTCVGLLFYYKYWNLLAADILGGTVLQPRTDMVTPLGLGYFTLAALSYTIDVYKRRCKVELNPLYYALFVSFFPTMTTGPIERYPHFRPQIHKSRRFSYTRCAGGAFRMLWGYAKKMVLADNLNLYIKMVYDTPAEMNGPNLLAATLLFSLRLYLDFSGCCDIAIGAARILGYDLLENFRSPLAHEPDRLAAGLYLHSAGRQPLQCGAPYAEHADCVCRQRPMARGGSALSGMGCCLRRDLGDCAADQSPAQGAVAV